MLGEVSQLQDLDEKSKTVKFTETKSRTVVARGQRKWVVAYMKAGLPR